MPIDKITNIILKDENYFIALINNDIINISNISFTKQLEFNLYYGLNPIEFLTKTEENMKNRLIKLGIINLILSPFILIYIFVSFIFKNIDEIYLNKKVLGPRRYTQHTKWKFREYNELEHYFNLRLNKSIKYANEYTKQFPSLVTENIFKFIGMISGAFIVLFLIFSILDENILLYVTFLDRSLIFYAGIFATLSAISRGFIIEPENSIYDPNGSMEKVAKYTHYMPEIWKNNCNTYVIRNEFLSMFNYIIILFFYEILGVFTTPYILIFILPKDVKKIHLFLKKNTIYIKGVGSICKLSNFDNNDIDIKLESSIMSFSDNHPLWKSTENF
jgi:autophagy-related protein 9